MLVFSLREWMLDAVSSRNLSLVICSQHPNIKSKSFVSDQTVPRGVYPVTCGLTENPSADTFFVFRSTSWINSLIVKETGSKEKV